MDRDAARMLGYLVLKAGCIHPFRMSRILVLANWRSLEKHGRILLGFRVEGFEAGFYIPGLKELLESSECFRVNEERRCVEYLCEEPELGVEEREILDGVLEEAQRLDDQELNRLVIRDPRYRELLKRGGFT